jgi:hypothetical protein
MKAFFGKPPMYVIDYPARDRDPVDCSALSR